MTDDAQADDLQNYGQGNGHDTMPQASLISQYVKDFSFENPNAPAVYQWPNQPDIDVRFNIGSEQLGEDLYEVQLKVMVKAQADEGTAFAVELVYAGLFGIRNVPLEQIQPFMLAEAPRLIFPFARRVLSDAIRDGGFPPLLLDPIDFAALYEEQLAKRAVAEGMPADKT